MVKRGSTSSGASPSFCTAARCLVWSLGVSLFLIWAGAFATFFAHSEHMSVVSGEQRSQLRVATRAGAESKAQKITRLLSSASVEVEALRQELGGAPTAPGSIAAAPAAAAAALEASTSSGDAAAAAQANEIETLRGQIALLRTQLAAASIGGGSGVKNDGKQAIASGSMRLQQRLAHNDESAIVRAFRSGKVNWHDLMPPDPNPPPASEPKARLMKLVKREKDLTYMLTFDPNDPTYGKDYGAKMAKHGQCTLLRDKCNIHDSAAECAENGFCYWCGSKGVCIGKHNSFLENSETKCPEEYQPRADEAQCSDFTLINNGRQSKTTNRGQCNVVVMQRAAFESVPSNAASMYWHWWGDYFGAFLGRLQSRGGLVDRASHIVIANNVQTPQFFHHFYLVSKFCWRTLKDIPSGTCFCNSVPAGPKAPNFKARDYIITQMGMPLQPKLAHPRIGLISRKQKRFILNERRLLEVGRSMGVSGELLPLEFMTFYEQLSRLQKTTILVGIHGSGLMNSMFLPRDSVVIQVVPYNVQGATSFFRPTAVANGMHYMEWRNPDQKNTVFHWQFVSAAVRLGAPARAAGVCCVVRTVSIALRAKLIGPSRFHLSVLRTAPASHSLSPHPALSHSPGKARQARAHTNARHAAEFDSLLHVLDQPGHGDRRERIQEDGQRRARARH
jgi:hypothetical protein